MEVKMKNLLTDGNCSYYFGKADKLSGEMHKKAFIDASSLIVNQCSIFFDDVQDIKIYLKQVDTLENRVHFKQKEEKNIISISKDYFFQNIKVFFECTYDSLENNEVIIFSENIYIIIYSDPIVIECLYGKDNCNFKHIKNKIFK